MEYAKGNKVIFANEMDLKEGVVVKVYTEYGKPMLLINDSIGSTFMRPSDRVIRCKLNQAKTAPDMYEALKRFLESSACTNGCDPDDMTCDTSFARKVLARAEGK